MKILLYIVILCSVLLVPARGTDVGKLIPIQVLAIAESGGMITVTTDTGEMGQGKTLRDAFENLKDTAPGVIYLDTAEYLLLESGLEAGDTLSGFLKGNVRVYRAPEGIELKEIADYLSAHKSDVKLKETEKNSRIPEITVEDGRFLLVEK